MALTTYRSTVAITTIPLRDAAYEKISLLMTHLVAFNLNMTRLQLMVDNFIEVDVNNPIPAGHVGHLGLQGPV